MEETPIKENLSIKLREKNGNEVLSVFSLDQVDEAYKMAEDLEQQGLEVILEIPTIFEQLAYQLGRNVEDKERFHESVNQENDEHEGRGCCVKQ